MLTFAKVDALQAGWKLLNGDEIAVAEKLLTRASAYLATLLERSSVVIDTSDEIQAINLETVVCNMVRRVMDAPGGMASVSQGIGSTNASVTFSNPDMSLYLSKADKVLLGIGKSQYRSVEAHTWADDLTPAHAYDGKTIDLKDVRFG